MFKIIPYALTISFVVITTFTYCQKQPVLIVQSFEYIWQKDFNASPAPRMIIFSDDSAKLELKNSCLKAIHNYCDIAVSPGSHYRFGVLAVDPGAFYRLADENDLTEFIVVRGLIMHCLIQLIKRSAAVFIFPPVIY